MSALKHGQGTIITLLDRSTTIPARKFTKPGISVDSLDVSLLVDDIEQTAPGGVRHIGALNFETPYDDAVNYASFLGQDPERVEIKWKTGRRETALAWFQSLDEPDIEGKTVAVRKLQMTLVSEIGQRVVDTPVIVLTGASAAITCATSGATIRYTTDGSTPTSSSTAYTTAVTLTSGQTIKAYASLAGCISSTVANSTYTAAALTFASIDSSVTGYAPWQLLSGSWGQMPTTSGYWTGAVAGGQDALFAVVPGGGGKLLAVVGNGINANTAMTARYISDVNQRNWTLQATDNACWFTENAVTGGMAPNVVIGYAFDDVVIKITMQVGNGIPGTGTYSTDGGVTFSSIGPISAGWRTDVAMMYRTYARGTFFAILETPTGGADVAPGIATTDSGSTWTNIGTTGRNVCAVEWDSGNGVFIAATKTWSGGVYSTTLTIVTATSLGGTWSSRQTFTLGDTAVGTDCANFRVVGSYVYALIKLGTGGWTLYRAALGSWAVSNPFTQVHQPGGTTSVMSISMPKLARDSKYRYNIGATVYVSTDGATWTTETTGNTNGAGQLAMLP